ncbi:YHYH domain-containing protein [Corallococcus sp. BB11-1]|uniref:YHYH domain-containing protein n=1 Tax=Corallococcus sp. BB11-1 TaxID=2996783 RepID=UPI002270D019|nr:YHYH domain-containing protein [Corallococcus sp. BB11-1]MCY1032241.1 YHYH domain-containing protein [Corallococcus sp. BB11-1]
MTRDRKALLVLGVLSALASSHVAWAHPGRTNSSGCHNERRTGGYHCHGGGGGGGGSGGWSELAEKPTRLQVIAIPRARVWINGAYVGLSPTKAVRIDGTQVKVTLEHAALGSHETTATVERGETTALTVRW